ncbi:hypothetical protein FJTKL_09821 [Diaporthe vaccinii]|uniref:Uncharacterized protein n=1 Tax=Diaporthe vaccinii TaxID=105482 RepID=A0ABR4EMB4_9PEZI
MIASSMKCPTTATPDFYHKRTLAGNPMPEQQGPLLQVFLMPNPRLDVHITLRVDQGTRPDPPDLPRRNLHLLDRLCG